jgi:hypothetical protein
MIHYLIGDETSGILRAHAEKAEQGAQPAAESLDALREGGVFALRAPREAGVPGRVRRRSPGAWPAWAGRARPRPGSPGPA